MRVLVADDDRLSAKVIKSIIERTGHECSVVGDGDSAWRVASGKDPPRVMFLDWVMPGIEGLELCRRIRALKRDYYIYIVIISARTKHRDIALGYQSGADDFITKPCRPQELTSRLRVAERVIRAQSPRQTFDSALAEACAAGGGDLIVRSGSVIGRVMIYHSKIAWAHISSEPGSLLAILASEPSIDRGDINAVLEECNATGRNFAEVLVDWGLIDHEALRERMRRWIQDKCESIRNLRLPTIIFSPENRDYSGGLLLDLAEVIPGAGASAGAGADASPPHLSLPADETAQVESTLTIGPALQREFDEHLDRAMTISGVVAVTLFDGDTGLTLGTRGVATDLEFAWHNLRLVASAESKDTVEDIIVTTEHHLHILRLYSRSPARFLFVTTNRANVQLGMLRLSLNECKP